MRRSGSRRIAGGVEDESAHRGGRQEVRVRVHAHGAAFGGRTGNSMAAWGREKADTGQCEKPARSGHTQ